MSRFEEVVNDAIGEVILGESAFRAETLAQHIAEKVRDRQGARRAEVHLEARYPEHKPAPHSGILTQEIYTLHGVAVASSAAGTRRLSGVTAQGMTACPCAQTLVQASVARAAAQADGFGDDEIERIFEAVPGRHAQPARARHALRRLPRGLRHRHRRQRLLAIVEDSMSSEIYELMKRSDEGAVVEKAHRRPRFVEDCVREMIRGVVDGLPELRDDVVRLRPPGEPRDDPPAQRRRRPLRDARRAAPRARLGRALSAPRLDARLARRRLLSTASPVAEPSRRRWRRSTIAIAPPRARRGPGRGRPSPRARRPRARATSARRTPPPAAGAAPPARASRAAPRTRARRRAPSRAGSGCRERAAGLDHAGRQHDQRARPPSRAPARSRRGTTWPVRLDRWM